MRYLAIDVSGLWSDLAVYLFAFGLGNNMEHLGST